MNAAELKESYVSAFPEWEKTALSKDPFWLRETRETALAHFGQAGFPTSKDEAWRHAPLEPIFNLPFELTGEKPAKAAVQEELRSLGFDTDKSHLLVFVNGHFSKELSAVKKLPEDVKVGSLIESLAYGPLKRHFGHILPFEDRPFVALNYAYFTDGLFVHVPKGQSVDLPIHAVYLSNNSGQATQSHIRNLILMEEGSRASLVEHYWGNNLKPYFNNLVTKVSLAASASLDHTKIQQESKMAYHLGIFAALLSENSRLTSRVFSDGGALGRHEMEVSLVEKRAECTLEGLALAKGKQYLEHRTFIDHAAPSCTSVQTFKGVVDGESVATFDGRVLVRENSQKTDARQVNKNLQLTKESKIYSKPQLQIYADDVKCSHGSATGQLDEEALFYFRSRGIGKEAARRMLVDAFAGEMVERIEAEYLKAPLRKMVNEWLGGKS